MLDHRDRALTARRVRRRCEVVLHQRPRDRHIRLHLELVLDASRVEGGRLAPVLGRRGEDVLAGPGRDTARVRVVVAEVGEEPVVEPLDALENRRDRRRRGRRAGAAVLPDRLALLCPVLSREQLRHPVLVEILERRDDVLLVVEVTALEVAVVPDRGRLLHERVALRARGVADRDLLLVLRSEPMGADRDGGEHRECAHEKSGDEETGAPSATPGRGRRDHGPDPSNVTSPAPSPDREALPVRTSLARVSQIPGAG